MHLSWNSVYIFFFVFSYEVSWTLEVATDCIKNYYVVFVFIYEPQCFSLVSVVCDALCVHPPHTKCLRLKQPRSLPQHCQSLMSSLRTWRSSRGSAPGSRVPWTPRRRPPSSGSGTVTRWSRTHGWHAFHLVGVFREREGLRGKVQADLLCPDPCKIALRKKLTNNLRHFQSFISVYHSMNPIVWPELNALLRYL